MICEYCLSVRLLLMLQLGLTPCDILLKAAKVLWGAKHGNYGPFADTIRNARVLFDFSAADTIAEGTGGSHVPGP